MHIASWICIRHAFLPSLRKMSDFPEFCSQQPLKIFRKFLNRIVAQTSSLYAIIFDSVKNAQFLSERRYSDLTHRKVGIFSHIFARPPPPGGETSEILLANYKGPPMPCHYLYNWLLPFARFRKSRPDKNRYRKKEEKKKVYIPKIYVDRRSAYGLSRRRRTKQISIWVCVLLLAKSPIGQLTNTWQQYYA